MLQITSYSSQQTKQIGEMFAKNLKGGEIFALVGNLGSGKTTFTKGLAKGLGIKKTVTSPTFVVCQIYKIPGNGNHKLFHFDLYRLNKFADTEEIGLAEALSGKENITIIEWPKMSKKILPKKTIFVQFRHNKNKEARTIIFHL